MSLDFTAKDVLHHIIAKFFPAYLPTAIKKYNAKPVMQEVLDVHGLASKAEVYNITTPAKVIEEGLLAAQELIFYLLADNYKIKLDICHFSVRIPGEFDGSETHLPQGVFPEVNVTVDNTFRNFFRDHAKVKFDGVEETQGYIGQILDGATGRVDEVVTRGNILTISGYGLKVEADADHASLAGVFLVTDSDFERTAEAPSDGQPADGQPAGGPIAPTDIVEIRVTAIPVNEPRTLKVLVPTSLITSKTYTIVIRTQSAVKGYHILKDLRTVTTDITLSVL